MSARLQPQAAEQASRASASGRLLRIDAVPVAAAVSGGRLATAWGDGCIRHFARQQAPDCMQVHDGAILALAADDAGGLLSGGDDGVFARTDAAGMQVLAHFPGQWVEHVAVSAEGGQACAVGRRVHLWDAAGGNQVLEHPSSVGGMAFDRSGRCLAVAHYGGLTLWTRDGPEWSAASLACRGSHLGVIWSPDGRYVLSSMQEQAVHGWRVADGMQLHIAGYPGKVRQWSWIEPMPWLASGGATAALLWPFDGKNGPLQRTPLALFQDDGQSLVSALCTLPGRATVLAGKSDGSILMGEATTPQQWHVLRHAGGTPLTLLAVLPEPHWLLAAHADGAVLWMPLLPP
ncbi:WD40 repeat domain-containing protein [Xanthomonas prunicola]|uniref:WD40 repeat domain-containing protein n=1 Tax=Xanthomonas prunicola TaxID=2053930 RepID=UPI0021B214BB|nr:WD40 repeat domain-containing protein [Xanthomonas prunicola]UXA69783.1 WD40 repeat domain-containing protein [Xanthomonas prunicola]